MSLTAHVYQIHINADADQVWAAITTSEWKRRYFHGTSYAEGPTAGARYRTVTADGGDAIDGTIEEMTPPGPGTPGRFVQTWHVLYDAELAAEPPSRVEWTIEQVGERLTRVRLVHGGLAFSPLTWANVKDGWVWVLDALKTVLETGRTLPRITVDTDDSPAPAEGDWHRRQGVEATNAASRCSRPSAAPPTTSSCSGSPTRRRTTGSAQRAPGRRTPYGPTTSSRAP